MPPVSLSRRSALRTVLPLAALPVLASCGIFSSSTSNGVTTVTIDTARLNTDGQAIVTMATAILANPLIASALGANLTAAQTLLSTVSMTMSKIADATAGKVSTSIDVSSVQGFVTTMLADVNQFVSLVMTVVPSVASGVVANTIQTYLTAISTLVPLIQLAVALTTPAAASIAPGRMTEAQAVALAHH